MRNAACGRAAGGRGCARSSQVLFQAADLGAQHPAVLLELLLALATALAGAAALARQMAPLPGEPRQHVAAAAPARPGCLRLAAARALVEEVEDQAAAVHRRDSRSPPRGSSPGSASGRRRRAGGRRPARGRRRRSLRPCPCRCRSPDRAPCGSARRARRPRAGALGELRQLVEVLVDDVARLAGKDQADQECPAGRAERLSSRLCNSLGPIGLF